jgi:hypothetical protein
MEDNQLVHQITCHFEGEEYLIEVFLRPDGSHFARTAFSPEDVIISDGVGLDDVLGKHQNLLPLAIHSRQMKLPFSMLN